MITLLSFAFIFLFSLCAGGILKKLKLPPLLGMILVGIALSPYAFNLIDQSILDISSNMRKIALLVILIRAGLSLDLNILKKVGRPALLMSFLPASFEILGMIIIAPKLLGITVLEAAILGSVLAAVSPAVVVPRMIKLIDQGYGTSKGIPQLIMAGASIDDVFVIVLFSSFTSIAVSQSVSVISFINIPLSIIIGILIGWIIGIAVNIVVNKLQTDKITTLLLIISISLILVGTEDIIATYIPFSGLVATMALGASFFKVNPTMTKQLNSQLNGIWSVAEILLFVLVGATVDLSFLATSAFTILFVIIFALLFRIVGVFLCLLRTKLNKKERAFSMIAYIPKATVQASIGSIPLAMGLPCGKLVITAAVLSILFTAPLGAIGIDLSYKKLLVKERNNQDL